MKASERRGLGRGLSALMADVNLDKQPERNGARSSDRAADRLVPIEKLHPNPDQPRRDFSKEDLATLAASIREKGIIQPLIVRPVPSLPDEFQIVAGERRWRAAQLANLHEVPVLVRKLNDTEAIEIAIIENIQRADLNPVEEALAYRQLMDKFGHTQEKLAESLSKSRSHIANLIRLLNLPEEVLGYLRNGKLSAGHARALVPAEDPALLARQIISKGLSVRQAESLAKNPVNKAKSTNKINVEKDADTKALEQDLSLNIGMKVTVDHNVKASNGTVTLAYNNLDQLDEICRILTSSMPRA
ncbi:MAG: ParB/RepB/Spo0J family partition protein [Proteobacteria bacterium]|nr:ParB/RepB/Spo0J family partition protein [Pseudomonadota bacterium]MDA1285246.1 ParB/RepB/Spo0J family partition protein [Pseudomonadota bacterium]